MLKPEWFAQQGYRCRLEWGRRGARDAAARGDILVVVDTISFSTTAATAIDRGAIIYPCAWDDDPAALAARVGAEATIRREELTKGGRFTLTPQTFFGVAPGTRVVLASPNGATCSRYGSAVPRLFVGALVNAAAVARAVARAMEETGRSATILACGERWDPPSEEGELRFAIEDYLGAGAILSYLDAPKSPEAFVCQESFLALQGRLDEVLKNCGSGVEMRERGYGQEVEHAAKLNLYGSVPVLRGERLERLE